MLLAAQDADLFFKLYPTLLFHVNQHLRVTGGFDRPAAFGELPIETRVEVRNALLGELDLIGRFVDENPAGLNEEELQIVRSWQHLVAGEFFIFRYLKKHTVFLSARKPATAYGVVGLTDPLETLAGPCLPILCEAVLLPFKSRIACDGLLVRSNIVFGGGIQRSLNEMYKEAKARQGIVTTLPAEARPAATKPAAKTRPRPQQSAKAKAKAKDATHDVLQVIVGMTDEFCRTHLNEEYAALCRKLAEKLARKRPSPLLSGRPNTWACGIVRTIGIVNFLDDRSQQPHMKLTAIDEAFNVAQSTGQGKSVAIRKLLKINRFDHQWLLPSRMDENPMIWMLEVNGFLLDIRDCPREMQQQAFKKGLIPYVPAERIGAERERA